MAEVILGRGTAWFAPLPRCPDHGQMTHRYLYHDVDGIRVFAGSLWICQGFDGEGCPYRVDDSELDWMELGQVDSAELRFAIGLDVGGDDND